MFKYIANNTGNKMTYVYDPEAAEFYVYFVPMKPIEKINLTFTAVRSNMKFEEVIK